MGLGNNLDVNSTSPEGRLKRIHIRYLEPVGAAIRTSTVVMVLIEQRVSYCHDQHIDGSNRQRHWGLTSIP